MFDKVDIVQLTKAANDQLILSNLQTWNDLRQAGHFSGIVATQIYCSSKATTSNKEHENLFFLLTKVVIQTKNIMNDVGKISGIKINIFFKSLF